MADTNGFNRDVKSMSSLRKWLLENIMPYTVGDKQQQEEMLGVEAMRILDRAFTSKTVVYDINKNYEQYETLGDALLSYLLEVLVLEKFPEADSGQISALNGEYGNNKYQAFIMNKIKASRHLLKAPNTDLTRYGILGDVFESMFYGIFLVVKRSYPNLAYNACYNLFHHFYDNPEFIELNFIYSRGDAKTIIVTKMFNKLRDRHSQLIDRTYGGPTYMAYVTEIKPQGKVEKAVVRVTIDLPKMTLLKIQGIDISTPIMAEASALSTDVASTEVYMNLLQQLDERGITEKKIDEIKFDQDVREVSTAPIYRAALTVASSKGYIKLEFDVDQKLSKSIGEDAKVLLLLGIKRDGTTDVLLCGIGSQDTTKTKLRLLEAYSKSVSFQMIDFRNK